MDFRDMYEEVNSDLSGGIIYIESEGANSLRADFDNETSVWFNEYEGKITASDNVGKYKKDVRKFCKKRKIEII